MSLSPAKKSLICAFIALNLVTVGFINVPAPLREDVESRVRREVSPTTAWSLATWGWRLRRYAHAVGLDNRWVMFSSVYRSDWHLEIRASYRNGASRLLPLPLQGDRTFWQRHFGDFREAKLHLNFYSDARAKSAYASYLAREFSHSDGAVIDAVSFEVQERSFARSPQEAATRGTHLNDDQRTWLLAHFRFSEHGAIK